MSQVCSNREAITSAILKYMKGLPEPLSLPLEISFEIRFEEATERHCIKFEDLERAADKKQSLSALASEIVSMYHKLCPDLPKVRSITDKRKRAIGTRLRERGIDDFRELFEKAAASDFLRGDNARGWVANFDWLLNEGNMVKVLEGQYDNRRGKKNNCNVSEEYQSFDVDDAFNKALSRNYGGNYDSI